MNPEMREKLAAGRKRAIKTATPEEREKRYQRMSDAQKGAWADKPPEERMAWAKKSAGNVAKARACITSLHAASHKANDARRKKFAEELAAAEIHGIAHLPRRKRKDYWLFSSKGFDHVEALSLVETGRLP